MKNFYDIDLKLCHYCGTCIGICPTDALAAVDGMPSLTGKCLECGLCFNGCPGIEFDYRKFNEYLFDGSKPDEEIGSFRSIYIGHSTDGLIRNKAGAGGVATAILSGLIKRAKIKAAVVVGMNKAKPWEVEVKIVNTVEDILNAAQSKYTMIPLNAILKEIGNAQGDIALVGLPCHIHGIRKLQKMRCSAVEKIKYCIGIFCGYNLDKKATDFLVDRLKINKEDILSLEYRGGQWPGGFLVKTEDGQRYFLKKDIYNYLELIFTPRRCLLCPDLTNEFADISIGDAWNKFLDDKGWSTIIVRTKIGEELIKESVQEKDIEVVTSDISKVKESHAHLLAHKKNGFYIRQRFLPEKPRFGLMAKSLKDKNPLFNFWSLCLFLFMRNKIVFSIAKYIPLRFLVLLSESFRFFCMSIFRPQKAIDTKGFFKRVASEYKYITSKEWSFRQAGDFWDSIIDYDEINKQTPSYFRRFVDGYKLSSLSDNSYVLDICSRTGNGTIFFWEKKKIEKVICADFSEKFLEVCSLRLKAKNINFERSLIETLPLPFKDGEFNGILSFETIEHVSRPDIFIKELSRVLKKSGELILTTPNVLWEPIFSLAAILQLHHSEGPHRCIGRKRLHRYIKESGLTIVKQSATVLIPAGPPLLLKLGEWIEDRTKNTLMPLLGMRRIYICKKN
jgi:coenzyme F420 hydrogenase subunit beta